MTNRFKAVRGFTLIELMIALAIVSILGAVAYGSYSNSVRKTIRNEAKNSLVNASALQEKYYFRFQSYASDLTELGYTLADNAPTEEGNYLISVNATSCSDNYARCYQLTAVTEGPQEQDSNCRRFVIDSTGAKQSFDAESGGSDTTDLCW